jgi:hypothetical protein
LPIFFACPTMRTMAWHVQYREGGTDHLVKYPTPEEAIESACHLIDKGCNVYAMGMSTGLLSTSISRDEIARIYAFWARPKTPLDRTEN